MSLIATLPVLTDHRNRRESAEPSAPIEADLTAGKLVSLTDLGVTPQTVFISPRTVGVNVKADLRRLRPHLVDSSSRRTSIASRSAKGIDDPLNEIRKRLASLEPPSRASDGPPSEPFVPNDASPSESAISSSIDLTAMTRSGRKLDSKVAAAVAATPTNAVGTTTIHDDLQSACSTPAVGASVSTGATAAPYSSSYEGQDPAVRAFLEHVDLVNYREPLLDFGPRITGNHRKQRGDRQKASNPQTVTMIAHLTQHTGAITSIIISPDHLFFATSSNDTQILVWDTARLERSVSAKPRLTYRMDARVAAMCRIENTHCLAAAAEDGQLHVLRVHASSIGGSARYGRIECIRTWRADEKDGHVTFVSHLQGEQVVQSSTYVRIVSPCCHVLLDDRSSRYPDHGDHTTLSTPSRARRHLIYLPIKPLADRRLRMWQPQFMGSPLRTSAQVMAGWRGNHVMPDSPVERTRTMGNGVDTPLHQRGERLGRGLRRRDRKVDGGVRGSVDSP